VSRELGVKVSLFQPVTDAKGVTSRGADALAKAGDKLVVCD
jgi:hypothetical protein